MRLHDRSLRAVAFSLCLVVLTLAGCDGRSGNEPGDGPGKRSQVLALTPDQELEVGREAYRKALAEMRGQILPAHSPEVIRARQICMKIVRAAGIRPLQQEINLKMRQYKFEWEVNVARSDQINAFCLPAGKIVVFTGIMNFAQDDDELAVVLAHEISHALAHHSSERVAQEQRLGNSGLLGLRHDRMQEAEADHIGLFLMTFAGFNPDAAAQLWERMERLNRGPQRPEILSDHPSDVRRARDLRAWTPNARAAKKAFDEGRVVRSND